MDILKIGPFVTLVAKTCSPSSIQTKDKEVRGTMHVEYMLNNLPWGGLGWVLNTLDTSKIIGGIVKHHASVKKTLGEVGAKPKPIPLSCTRGYNAWLNVPMGFMEGQIL